MLNVFRTNSNVPHLTLFIAALTANGASAAQSYNIANGTGQTVNEFSECRVVTNNHASGRALFVPTNTTGEWSDFRLNFPTGVTVASCCAMTSPQIFTTAGDQTQITVAAGCSSMTVHAWGGGGGGGVFVTGNQPAGVGGPGGYVTQTVSVTGGNTIDITVGDGGGGATTVAGGAGGAAGSTTNAGGAGGTNTPTAGSVGGGTLTGTNGGTTTNGNARNGGAGKAGGGGGGAITLGGGGGGGGASRILKSGGSSVTVIAGGGGGGGARGDNGGSNPNGAPGCGAVAGADTSTKMIGGGGGAGACQHTGGSTQAGTIGNVPAPTVVVNGVTYPTGSRANGGTAGVSGSTAGGAGVNGMVVLTFQ